MSSAVSRCESIDEVEEKVLEDNRARCDFFKDFEFDIEGIIGSVSSKSLEFSSHQFFDMI